MLAPYDSEKPSKRGIYRNLDWGNLPEIDHDLWYTILPRLDAGGDSYLWMYHLHLPWRFSPKTPTPKRQICGRNICHTCQLCDSNVSSRSCFMHIFGTRMLAGRNEQYWPETYSVFGRFGVYLNIIVFVFEYTGIIWILAKALIPRDKNLFCKYVWIYWLFDLL